jgi:hypothetical protein
MRTHAVKNAGTNATMIRGAGGAIRLRFTIGFHHMRIHSVHVIGNMDNLSDGEGNFELVCFFASPLLDDDTSSCCKESMKHDRWVKNG